MPDEIQETSPPNSGTRFSERRRFCCERILQDGQQPLVRSVASGAQATRLVPDVDRRRPWLIFDADHGQELARLIS